MWLFSYFIQEATNAALSDRVIAGTKKNHEQESKRIAYFQLVTYLLQTSATNDVTTKPQRKMADFNQSPGITFVCYYEALWEKVLRLGSVKMH